MKKQIIVVGISLLLIIIGLCGCTDNEKQVQKKSTNPEYFINTWTPDGYNYIKFDSNGLLSYYGLEGSWELNNEKLKIFIPSWDWITEVDFKFSNNYEKLDLIGIVDLPTRNSTVSYTKTNLSDLDIAINDISTNENWEYEFVDVWHMPPHGNNRTTYLFDFQKVKIDVTVDGYYALSYSRNYKFEDGKLGIIYEEGTYEPGSTYEITYYYNFTFSNNYNRLELVCDYLNETLIFIRQYGNYN